MAEDRGCPR